eukprot:gene8849-18335_t
MGFWRKYSYISFMILVFLEWLNCLVIKDLKGSSLVSNRQKRREHVLHFQENRLPSSQQDDKIYTITDAGPNCTSSVSFLIATAKSRSSYGNPIVPSIFNILFLQEFDRIQSSFTDSKRLLRRQFIAKESINGTIIGYIDADRTGFDPVQFPSPYLSDIVVDENWRRRGVAEALMQRCESLCKNEWQESSMFLWVHTNNTPAMHLYRKLQYHPIRGETGNLGGDGGSSSSDQLKRSENLDKSTNSCNGEYNDEEDYWDDLLIRFDRILLRKNLPKRYGVKDYRSKVL